MSDQTVNQNDLAKALTALQDLAKGHSSRGTNSTAVETMQDANRGAGSGAGSTQVFHTPSNSDPKSWAGSAVESEGDDGAHDGIDANGTDYRGASAVMKSILDKLAKGKTLSASEFDQVKGMACDDKDEKVAKAKAKGKAPPFGGKETAEEEEAEEDAKEAMGKSLSDFASESDGVTRGFEVSEFLADFADVVQKSLNALEERVVYRLSSAVGAATSDTGEFQKSLAGAIAGLGETLSAVVQRVDQVENQAARPPMSIQGIQEITKGGYGGPSDGEPLNKAMVGEALVQLVQDGKARVNDVIKYESTGQISPMLETTVRGMLRSGR